MRAPSPMPSHLLLATLVGGLVGALLAPWPAQAKPDRRGFHSEFTLGASACVSGRAQCSFENETLEGKTKPNAGFGVTLGFRPMRVLMVGAAYNLGFFNPDYALAGADVYRRAVQNSFFAVARAILPLGRFDLGLELGPGWSRQTFRGTDDALFARVSSQGFAFKMGPVIDLYVTRHVFIGAKADFIFNFHREVCTDALGEARACVRTQETDQAAVHQVIAGFHVGSVF